MYSKIVKVGKRKYKYYYHNIKVNNKVKNIILGKSRKEALIKLKKLKSGVNYNTIRKVVLNKNKSSLKIKRKRLAESGLTTDKVENYKNKLVYESSQKIKKNGFAKSANAFASKPLKSNKYYKYLNLSNLKLSKKIKNKKPSLNTVETYIHPVDYSKNKGYINVSVKDKATVARHGRALALRARVHPDVRVQTRKGESPGGGVQSNLSFKQLLKNTPSYAQPLSAGPNIIPNKFNNYSKVFNKKENKKTRSQNLVTQRDSVVSLRLNKNRNNIYKKLSFLDKDEVAESGKAADLRSVVSLRDLRVRNTRKYEDPALIVQNNFKQLLKNTPSHTQPSARIRSPDAMPSKFNLTLLIILSLLIGIGVLSYFTQDFGITSLVVYSEDKIMLDVNKLVSKDAKIFVNVANFEESKSITEFNLALINETFYQVNSLEIELTSFNFSLDPGTYTFIISLIDNINNSNELIAINSKDITISLEEQPLPEENITQPLPEENETILPQPEIILPENITNETLPEAPEILPEVQVNLSIKIEQEVIDEINSKGEARVIVRKEFSLVTIDDLIDEIEQNISKKELRFSKKNELVSVIKKELDNNTFDLNDFAKLEEKIREREQKKREKSREISSLDVVQLIDDVDKLKALINESEIIEVEQEVDDIVALNVDINLLNKLSNLSSVNEIILDREVNLFVHDAINITKINVVQQNYTGLGKSVCVLDTGINYNLFNLVLNETIFGKDFINQDDDPLDDNGHGTSVSNILLKTAPNSKLFIAKVIDASGIGYESDVLAGLQYCINNNVDVISLSIGSSLSNGYCDSNLVANKTNQAVEQGIYVVAATGNDGSNNKIRVPACASKVTRVASSSKQDNISSFSNIFLNDLLSPGENLNNIGLNGENIISSGTSFSAPLVSGSALLILENRTLNASNLTYLFRSTGDIIQGNDRIYDRINVYNALINNFTHIPFDYNANVSQVEVPSGEFFGFANPSFNTPTLNTTNVLTNNTNVNLTLSIIHNDATALYNITTWYENNISLLVLNMPFTTNTTDVKDYSGYNNNGTISGALWQRYLNEDNNSLVLLLPFDEDNSSTAIDKGDYKNNGILGNVTQNTQPNITSNCITGKCYSFDGINDYINISSSQFKTYHPRGAFTIEAWINTNGTTNKQGIVDTADSGFTGFSLALGIDANSGRIQTTLANNTIDQSIFSSSVLNNNSWYHIAFIWDGTTNANGRKIYINGILDLQSTSTVSGNINSSRDLTIGASGRASQTFNGSIDNVRIYNKALTSNEIKDHYEKYKLYYSPSFKFDGAGGDRIDINKGVINPDTTGTIELWFKPSYDWDDTAINLNLIDIGNALTIDGTNQFGIFYEQGGNEMRFETDNGPTRTSFDTVGLNLNTTWTHYIFTYTETQWRNYINGRLSNTLDVSSTTFPTNFSGQNLTIGSVNSGANTINGSITQVRIYNRSLSANQIYELYNSYNTSALNKLVSEETTAGRTYKAQVYVANSSDIGVSANTSELLILSEYLTFTNSPVINSTNGLNTTEQDLNVFFTPNGQGSTNLNYSIEVFKNNASSFSIGNISTTDNIFTRFIINNANTTKGETFKAQVRLSDGVGFSSYTNTSELLILNYVPNITFSLINSTDVLTNNTNVNLTLKINISDFDTDTVFNFTGTWYEDNQSILVLNMPFVTNNSDVKDYSGYNNNGTISGALWQRYLNEDNNSLVLLMPFDEDNSTTAIDKSDYKNNGVLSGGVALNRTDCVTGTCYTFNGTLSSINISYSPSFNFENNTFTIEVWARSNNNYDGITPGVLIASSPYSGDSGFYLRLEDNIMRANIRKPTGATFPLSSTISFNDNRWHHYVATRVNITSIKFYFDGRDVTVESGNTFDGTNNFSTTTTKYIGQSGTTVHFFNGSIDNVRIYNKALTSSEILDHYEKVKLYYSPSFKFDGNVSYIQVNNSKTINITTNDFSWEVWVKQGTQDNYGTILSKGNSNRPSVYLDMPSEVPNDGKVRIIFRNSSNSVISIQSTILINDTKWSHIVGTFQRSTNTAKLYINGNLNATSTSIPAGKFEDENPLVIGAKPVGDASGTKQNYFNGSISSVRIYNRSLSANQIYELYNSYNTSALNKLVSEETTAGRTYKASLYASDTFADSSQVNTSEILILDLLPYFAVNPVINSTDTTNRTTINLNVFFTPRINQTDNLNYSIMVFTNNRTNFTLYNIATTNNTFTNLVIQSKNLTKGQTWHAQVWLTYLDTNSTLVNTSELLILNTAPIFTQGYPQINSTDGLNQSTKNLASVFIATDVDIGETLTYTRQVFTNNISNFTDISSKSYTNGTLVYDIINSLNLTKGQTWKVQIGVNDGTTTNYTNTSELLMANTIPAFDGGYPQINSTDGSNLTTRNLHVTFKANDTDVQDVLSYDIQVFTNNVSNFTLRNIAYINGSFITEIIQSRNFTKGQTWKAQINLSDGSSNIFANTSEILILNTAPQFQISPVINSTNGLNTTEQNLNVFFTPNETDVNDRLNYSVQVFKNNITNFSLYNIATTNGTFTNFVINNGNTTKGETWKTQVWTTDGTSNSTLVNTTELLILNNRTSQATITEPINTSYLSSVSVTFRWQNGTDTDSDLIRHILWIANNTGFTTTTIFTTLFTNTSTQTLGDGVYYWKVIEYDGEQNSTDSETFTFTVDTIQAIILFTSPTESNNTFSNRDYVFINTSVTETNFANITFYLVNSTTVNKTVFTSLIGNSRQVNLSPLNQNEVFRYNVSVTDLANNINYTETRTITLDNILPVPVYDSRTELNNTYVNRNWTFINITLTEINLANITYVISNNSFTNTTIYGSRILDINFTNLVDGNYTYNVTARDLANNVNSTETRTIVIDTLIPTISYSAQTEANNTYKNQNFIFVNWTYTETNFANLTFRLFNTTSNVNTTVYTSTTYQINVSNYTSYLINPNEKYTYNVTILDQANNQNTTETRTITLDNTLPLISYLPETEANNTYVNRNYILINTTLTETNFANITYRIFNTTSLYNLSFFTNSTNQINISVNNLNEIYTYNVTIIDLANNQNVTETRTLTFDNTLPNNITLLSPSNNTVSTNRTPLFTWNNVTELNFENYTLEIDNDADFSSVQFTFVKTNTTANSTHLMTSPLNDNTRYFWRITVKDKANNQNSTTFTYTTDNTNPSVTLNSPGNNIWLTTSTVNFQYIPTDAPFNANLQACDLYGNFTSTTFQKNNTQTPTGGAINTFTLILADSSYTWNVQCNDSAGNSARATNNFTVNLDTVRPSLSYSSQTEANNTYKNQNFIFVNWTYTETNFANLTFRLFNTTSNVNTTVYTSTVYQINVSNYTSYLINPNEKYTYNITLIDYALQENVTETRTLTLDNTNPLISYSAQTLANNSYSSSNTLFVNWTYTETNFANLTFTLTNLTAIVNQTIYNTTAYQINLTLPNTNYTYNLTIRDLANNYNATETRVLVLDTILPVPVYDSRTELNNTYVNRNWTFINITLTEINLANITYVISNNSFTNTTIYGSRTLSINFTNLVDGNYTYNVTVRDLANNVNSTETRTIVIDTILPVVQYSAQTLENNTYINQDFIFVNWTITEINLANITFSLYNTTSRVNETVYGNRIYQINVTNLPKDINYTYNVTARDLANNVNTTDTRTIILDAIPLISFGNNVDSNDTYFQRNWIFVNVTVTEEFETNTTFRLFNQTGLVNETISNTKIRSINFTNLSNRNVIYTYNVTVKDLANNQNTTETRRIRIDNVIPSIPILGNPRNDTWQLFDNATVFDWSNSTDLENTTLNYEFQLSNSTAFNTTYFIKNITISQSNFTLTVNEMPSVGKHYWRVRSFDGINHSNYSNLFQVDVVYAVINITSPNYNSIVRILNEYTFKVEEIANPGWVQNVNITFTASSSTSGPFVMANNSDPITNYTQNFTIPNVEAGFLDVIARGYNGSLSVNATSKFRITIPETPTITRPEITDIYSLNTYTYPNVSANITVKSDLSLLINTITVRIIQPNDTISTLNSISDNEDNAVNNSFNYEHNYTFTPGELGEYIVEVSVTDTNFPDSGFTARKNNSFYVNTSRGILLTTSGINNITLNDIYSKLTLNKLNNSVNTTIVPGNYNTKVSTSRTDTVLVNASLFNDFSSLCTFEDIGETITAPDNTRAVDQFTLDCGNATFSHANLTYNYTNVLGSITFEENLKIYKCASSSSCTWVRQNTTKQTDQNLITANFNAFSVFMLSEDTATTTTTTVTTTGGAGGGAGGGLSKLIAIDIIQPGDVSVYTDDTIITPLIIKNSGRTSLFGISLSASTLSEGLELALDTDYISSLVVGQQTIANLIITSENFTGDQAEILVTAKVTTPSIQDQVKFLITSLGGRGEKAEAEEQIEFANNLFNGNPECLELKELINQAQTAYDNNDYAKAISLADSAIQSCKNLLSLLGKEVKLPKKPTPISEVLILSLEALVFFILTYAMYNYYKRRKLKLRK